METVYLNLLVSILFTTSSLHLLEASPCSCNGVTTSEGWGECKTIYMGKPWCYIDNEANCEDRMVSSKTNKGFSFQACENQIAQSSPCSCNGLISSRGGECTKKYRGRLWCYVSPEAGCVDRKESQTIEGESWSFQACRESNSECRVESVGDCSEVSQECRVESVGDCSENLSNVECFPEEFWDNVRVFDAAEDGTIPCEDKNDCPDYDISTMQRILGLSDAWQPTLVCNYDILDPYDMTKECRLHRGTQLGCGVDFDGNQCEYDQYFIETSGCRLDIKGDPCGEAFFSGGTPLSYTTSTSSQSLIQPISTVTGECSSSTCRRGNLCCPVVWAGSNRQYICPPYC